MGIGLARMASLYITAITATYPTSRQVPLCYHKFPIHFHTPVLKFGRGKCTVNCSLYFCRKYEGRCRIIGLSYSRKFNYSSSVTHWETVMILL